MDGDITLLPSRLHWKNQMSILRHQGLFKEEATETFHPVQWILPSFWHPLPQHHSRHCGSALLTLGLVNALAACAAITRQRELSLLSGGSGKGKWNRLMFDVDPSHVKHCAEKIYALKIFSPCISQRSRCHDFCS